MNILFITPSVPSRLHRIRSYDLIKALSKRHKIHLLSLDSNNDFLPLELMKSVATFSVVYKAKWKSYVDCIISLFSWLPLEISFCKSVEMKRKVREIIETKKIDLIYVKRLRSYQFVDNLKYDLPIIVDTTDAMSLFYKRAYKNAPWYKKALFFEEFIKYLLYERFISKKNINLVTCSLVDKDYLHSKYDNLKIDVIPNIVDTEFFKRTLSENNSSVEKHSILFSGLMDKFVNIEGADFFVKKVFPIILAKYSDARLYIVGPNPVSHIKRYSSKNIIVTGFVQELRDFMRKAKVVVCPIITGTGVRNKILQAWAMEKPVVSTTVGWQGLAGKDREHLLLADKPEFFAKCITDLFENAEFSKGLAKNGRKLAETSYSDAVVRNTIESFFYKIAKSRV